MITVFDMASGQYQAPIGEPADETQPIETVRRQEVQLRLLTVDEAMRAEQAATPIR